MAALQIERAAVRTLATMCSCSRLNWEVDHIWSRVFLNKHMQWELWPHAGMLQQTILSKTRLFSFWESEETCSGWSSSIENCSRPLYFSLSCCNSNCQRAAAFQVLSAATADMLAVGVSPRAAAAVQQTRHWPIFWGRLRLINFHELIWFSADWMKTLWTIVPYYLSSRAFTPWLVTSGKMIFTAVHL